MTIEASSASEVKAPAPVPRADARAPVVVAFALAGVAGLAWVARRRAARDRAERQTAGKGTSVGALPAGRAGLPISGFLLGTAGVVGALAVSRAEGRVARLLPFVRLAIDWTRQPRPLWPGVDGKAGLAAAGSSTGARNPITLLTAGVLLGAVAGVPLGWAARDRDGRTAGEAFPATPRSADPVGRARRRLLLGALLLDVAVLADSGLEHYRACFANPAMYAPLVTATLDILANGLAMTGQARGQVVRDGVHLLAVGVGLTGLGFHLYNIGKRPGGYCWLNFFYGAPFGAPGALVLAGLIGWASERLDLSAPAGDQRLLGLPFGHAIAALAGFGIFGTVSEVGLLHFRGAYHNPFMWLPVTLPPLSAAALAKAALLPAGPEPWATQAILQATALLGVLGVGFHAYGVQRNMGGWRNWSQNILAGPPLPAPPSFLALAIAGLGALQLIEGDAR